MTAARFKQADLTRAMRAAAAAGMKPSECVIDERGVIRLIFGDAPIAGAANPLDRLLAKP